VVSFLSKQAVARKQRLATVAVVPGETPQGKYGAVGNEMVLCPPLFHQNAVRVGVAPFYMAPTVLARFDSGRGLSQLNTIRS